MDGQHWIDILNALSTVPFHAILIGISLIEGYAVYRLFLLYMSVRDKLDECLGNDD